MTKCRKCGEVISMCVCVEPERYLVDETPTTQSNPSTEQTGKAKEWWITCLDEPADGKWIGLSEDSWKIGLGRGAMKAIMVNEKPKNPLYIHVREVLQGSGACAGESPVDTGKPKEEKTCLEMGGDCPVCFPKGYDHDKPSKSKPAPKILKSPVAS